MNHSRRWARLAAVAVLLGALGWCLSVDRQRPSTNTVTTVVISNGARILAKPRDLALPAIAPKEPLAPAAGAHQEAMIPPRSSDGPPGPRSVPGVLLVKFRAGLSPGAVAAFLDGRGLAMQREIASLGIKVLQVPRGAEEALAKALAQCPEVEFAETDAIGDLCLVPNDPNYYRQWQLPKISAPAGWDISTGLGSVIIADVDTGFDPSNRDIGPKLLPGYNAVLGTTDTRNSTQWVHGTVTASLAAGIGNDGYGTAGVAWGCPILPVVVVDSAGTLPVSACAAGITWAADHGARVINMSWIFYLNPATTIVNAVNYAWNRGCVLVAAAGNNNTATLNGYTPYPPL